jgi:hypothetical protein
MWLKQLGEMLQATPKAPGTKGNLAGKDSSGGRIARPPEKVIPTLAEIGISKDTSALAQKLASLPA